MPKRSSISKLSRRTLAKSRCRIEAAISELSLATVCSSAADLSHLSADSVGVDTEVQIMPCKSNTRSHKSASSMSCCPQCSLPLPEDSTEPKAILQNSGKASDNEGSKCLDEKRKTQVEKDTNLKMQDSVPQHVLLEYVKGLQDANRSRDADTAERLLQDLGDCLDSLASASTVVSAGGARTIASTLKLFKHHSSQKLPKDTVKEPTNKTDKCEDLMDCNMVPTAEIIKSEVGRKRHRTIVNLEESCLPYKEELDFESILESNYIRSQNNHDDQSTNTGCFEVLDQSGMSHSDACPSESSDTLSLKSDNWSEQTMFHDDMLGLVDGNSLDSGKSNDDSLLHGLHDGSPGFQERCPETLSSDPLREALASVSTQCQRSSKQSENREEGVDDIKTTTLHCSKEMHINEHQKYSQNGLKEDHARNVSDVLPFAKGSGLVSASCFALERLLNAILQGRRTLKSQVFFNSAGERQRDTLRAEMYVALTEAFVDILQPLKDIFSMLLWCLDCLAYILPPCSTESCMGYSAVQSAVAACLANKELRKPLKDGEACSFHAGFRVRAHQSCKEHGMVSCNFGLSTSSNSLDGGSSKPQGGDNSSSNDSNDEIDTELAASSISALAAVAYSATVPMLAEKAVKAILLVVHSRDIDSEPTVAAALRALSAHLSPVSSRSLCDDAFAFIIAAMKKHLSSTEVQIDGLLAIGSLIRAFNSTMGHIAWVTVIASMGYHRQDVNLQRVGCSTLQRLCAKTSIGHSDWSNYKRPLKASKDLDREGGARALILAMSQFPDDVRIQWYACSTLWNLVHCAGVNSVIAMVKYGAVAAVIGAMTVCRTNEVVQQEGCNALGTIAKTLAENGGKPAELIQPSFFVDTAAGEPQGRHDTVDSEDATRITDEVVSLQVDIKTFATVHDWHVALWTVVGAMKSFKTSESVQSYGTYALGSLLKVFTEASPSTSYFEVLFLSDIHPDNEVTTESSNIEMQYKSELVQTEEMPSKCRPSKTFETNTVSGSSVLDCITKLHQVFEVILIAMQGFPKNETVQIWGCAVLQQVFPVYIHVAQAMFKVLIDKNEGYDVSHCPIHATSGSHDKENLVSSGRDYVKGSCGHGNLCRTEDKISCLKCVLKACETSTLSASQGNNPFTSTKEIGVFESYQCGKFVDLVLLQAVTAVSLLSDAVAADTNDKKSKESETSTDSNQHFKCSSRCVRNKFTGMKFAYESGSAKLYISMRQSWFASFSVLGDVFYVISKLLAIFICEQKIKDSEFSRFSNSQQPSSTNVDCLKIGNKSKVFFDSVSEGNEKLKDGKILKNVLSSETFSGLPILLKKLIKVTLKALSEMEDSETVIWALQALPNLYTAWKTVCVSISGSTNHIELKLMLWGNEDVGLKDLIALISHWNEQNRMDIIILALHSLYCACISVATANEIECNFGFQKFGMQVLVAILQKSLCHNVGIKQRRKLLHLSFHVLRAVCSYSVNSQFSFATSGGADFVVAALVRFYDDEQVYASGLKALGIDYHLKSDFSTTLDTAIKRNMTSIGGKSSKRKKSSSNACNVMIGFTHVFKEFISRTNNKENENLGKENWTAQFRRLLAFSKDQMGLFHTLVSAGPGCGGPHLTVELLKELNRELLKETLTSEAKAHLCLIISFMADNDPVWRKDLIRLGAIDVVLSTLDSVFNWQDEAFSINVANDTLEKSLDSNKSFLLVTSNFSSAGDQTSVDKGTRSNKDSRDVILEHAACWALANLAKDHKDFGSEVLFNLIQAVIVLLQRHGGLLSHLAHSEVCVPARLLLARLGVTRIDNQLLFHLASEAGDLTSLEVLVNKGANIWVQDSCGQTTLQIAEKNGQAEVLQYFKSLSNSQKKKKSRGKAVSKCKQNDQEDKQCGGNMCVDKKLHDCQSKVVDTKETNHITNPSSCSIEASTKPDHSSRIKVEKQDLIEKTRIKIPDASAVVDSTCQVEHLQLGTKLKSENAVVLNKKQRKKCIKTAVSISDRDTEIRAAEHISAELLKRSSPKQENHTGKSKETPFLETEFKNTLNVVLQEALVSGDIEKLENALRACETAPTVPDKELVKKVHASLQKKLKRIEKCASLKNNLGSSINEGNKGRLAAAIAMAESVPRYAAALQVELIEARKELSRIESEEFEGNTAKEENKECLAMSLKNGLDECKSLDQLKPLSTSKHPEQLLENTGESHELLNEVPSYLSAVREMQNLEPWKLTRQQPVPVKTTYNCKSETELESKLRVSSTEWSQQPMDVQSNKASYSRTLGLWNSVRPSAYTTSGQSFLRNSYVARPDKHNLNHEFPNITGFTRDSETRIYRPPLNIYGEEARSIQAVSNSSNIFQSISSDTLQHGKFCNSSNLAIEPPHSSHMTRGDPITSQLFPTTGGSALEFGYGRPESNIWKADNPFESQREFRSSPVDHVLSGIATQKIHSDAYIPPCLPRNIQNNDFVGSSHYSFQPLNHARTPDYMPCFSRDGLSMNSVSKPDVSLQECIFPSLALRTDAHDQQNLYPADHKVEIGQRSKSVENGVQDPFLQFIDNTWSYYHNEQQESRDNRTLLYAESPTTNGSSLDLPCRFSSGKLAEMLEDISLNSVSVGRICPLCQQTCKEVDILLLPCGHFLCRVCTGKAQMCGSHCPICNCFF